MAASLLIAFAGLAVLVALANWRLGWLFAILVGLAQDPARKLTAGSPVAMTYTIIVVYAAVVISSHRSLQVHALDFMRRFRSIASAVTIVVLFLFIAAVNGLFTFGLALWKAPMLSLFIYLAPVPAILVGYQWMRREEDLIGFFRFYTVITSFFLIGSTLEYLRFNWRALGMVNQIGDYIRFSQGLQVRMISGFYRAPDIMGWHAATLTAIAIAMVVRTGITMAAWPWVLAGGWGFFNCMISGRRKAVYFVIAFILMFVWRYFKRLRSTQTIAFVAVALVMGVVVYRFASHEETRIYALGAVASRSEVQHRLEGGLIETFRQFGVMGAGLGAATQGIQHIVGSDMHVGWQEGGLGKLAVELGLPGFLAAVFLAWTVAATFLYMGAYPDEDGCSQLVRVILLSLAFANVVNFMVSSQAYSDPVLALITAFLVGCMFATAKVTEHQAVPAAVDPALTPATA